MKLYELTGGLETLLTYYADSDGSNAEEILAGIYEIEIERDEKLAACCAVYKNMMAERDAIDAELKRLRAKIDAQETKCDNFKRYISNNLLPGEKWGNGVHKISWRSSESVEILDESRIPYEYWRIKKEPDKTSIKAKIKLGEMVEGAVMVHKNNIQIG